MQSDEKPPTLDSRSLQDASASLLGYFVATWYGHYLNVIVDNLRSLQERGLIESLEHPTLAGSYSALFDFNVLNIEKATYINGIYFYILSRHKAANRRLMERYDGKQVLYLCGYDFEGSVAAGGKQAVGFSTLDTAQFSFMLGEHFAPPQFQLFKALSPKDVYWETTGAQRYFYSEFADIVSFAAGGPICSIYLNAMRWKEGISHLLDRMDYFVVYVSSITESVLWELDQLDTDDRRNRVTVVFDEQAISRKEDHLDFQDKIQSAYKPLWSKNRPPPGHSVAEWREQLSQKFLLTTREAFQKEIDVHRQRIAESSGRLSPGARETWVDFQFHPALDEHKLKGLSDFSAWVQRQIATCTETGIACLPLFLDQVQMRIFMTLLMGEHHETGRALAAYAAVMQGSLDYYAQPGEKIGDLSAERRSFHLDLLKEHGEMARHVGMRMLSFGKSHEFDDFTVIARTDFNASFEATKAAVTRFFEIAAERGRSRKE